MLRLSDALRAIEDAAEIQVTACSMLVDELNADRAGYAELLSGSGSVSVRRDAAVDVRSLAGDHQIADFETQLCERLRCGEVDVHADVADDPVLSSAEKAAHAAMDIGATVNVPLFEAGELKGFFFLH